MEVKTADVKELTTTSIWVSCAYCDKAYMKIIMLDDGIVKCPNCGETFRVISTPETEWIMKEIKGDKFEELRD